MTFQDGAEWTEHGQEAKVARPGARRAGETPAVAGRRPVGFGALDPELVVARSLRIGLGAARVSGFFSG